MRFKGFNRLFHADNIYQSIKPLVYISLIGLAPFRMHSKTEVETSGPRLAISIGHLSFYTLCLGLSLREGDSIIEYFFKTNLTELSDRTLMLTGVIAMFTIFGFAIFKRNNLIKVIQRNIVVDEVFVKLGREVDYRRIRLYSFVMSLGMVTFSLGYLCVSYVLLVLACNKPTFVTFTTYALPHINTTIMVFKFMCTTYLVKSRFQMLNEILHELLDSSIENELQTPSKPPSYSIDSLIHQNPRQTLKELTNIHNHLCDICITIEGYFTYPLLTIVTTSFLFIVFDDYYILEVLLSPNRVGMWEAYEFFTFFSTQMCWYVIIILAIVEGSSKTIKETEKTAALVSKLLNATEDLEIRDQLKRLSMQLIHRKVCFSAAGLFALDRTLIFNISGAATCYLIILIQFRSTTIFHDKSSNCTARYV